MKSKSAKLIMNEVNIRYILGFNAEGYILLLGDDIIFFTDPRYIEEASRRLDFRVIQYEKSPLVEIFDFLVDNMINSLEFERNINYSMFLALKKVAREKKIKLESNVDVIEERRLIKKADEIELIKKSAKINDMIFSDVLKEIKLGVSEIELNNILECSLRKYDASRSSFDLIVLFGKRTSMPHGISTDYLLDNNMPILFDIGVEYKGYASDMTRMVHFGKASREFIRDYEFVKEIQEEALSMVSEGTYCKDIDQFIRDKLNSKDIPILHSTGHGVGLKVHEKPNISIRSDDILKENMVITIEPGIYFKDKYGIRIEDLVLVKKNGYEVLSKVDKNLIYI